MEKAILKTLAYANIFDYPLNIFEVHRWLIGRKATLRQMEAALGGLVKSEKCKVQSGYYVLPMRDGMVAKRQRRKKQSGWYLKKAKVLTPVLKLIPWIKLVGVSGGLAMENAEKRDDIDLFIITAKNRLWLSRILALGLLSLTGQRRKAGETGRKIVGKLCVNILLEEDRLGQKSKDIYLAHEVLQMKVLWQRDGIYGKYLSDNNWAFKFLPNWTTQERLKINDLKNIHKSSIINHKSILDWIEDLAKKFQLIIMGSPKGMERIEDGALYFHPNDIRQKILKEYANRIKTIP